MGQVVAGITTSLDGYVAGPDDRPGRGLGTGGEQLHYWVFGGHWSYDEQPSGEFSERSTAPPPTRITAGPLPSRS